MSQPTTEGPRDEETRTVRLTFPARPEYVTLCRLALTGISRLRPLDEELLADLKLALTEAVSNSVRHAYPGGEGVVQVVYSLRPESLAIEVLDDGAGFDPATARGRSDGIAEGGLGLSIIRAIADDVEIGPRADGAGSRLRFVKTLA